MSLVSISIVQLVSQLQPQLTICLACIICAAVRLCIQAGKQPGSNTQFLLYPRYFRWYNKLLLFYVSLDDMGPSRCYKPAIFYILYSQLLYPNPWLRYRYYRFWKQAAAIPEDYSKFRFWPYYHKRRVILHRSTKLHPNRNITGRVAMSYRLFKMAATTSQIYFRFRVWSRHSSENAEIYS